MRNALRLTGLDELLVLNYFFGPSQKQTNKQTFLRKVKTKYQTSVLEPSFLLWKTENFGVLTNWIMGIRIIIKNITEISKESSLDIHLSLSRQNLTFQFKSRLYYVSYNTF